MMLGFLLGAVLGGAPLAEFAFPCDSAGDLADVKAELEEGRCPPLCRINEGDIMHLSHQAFICSGGYNRWSTLDKQLGQIFYSYLGHESASDNYKMIVAHCRYHGCLREG